MEIAESALSLVQSASSGNSAPASSGGSGASSPSAATPATAPSVSAGELPVGANTIVQRNIDLLLGGLTYTSGGASGGGSSTGNLVNATA